MADNDFSPHGTPPERSLPPVEAPNARLIVQLFLVPLILVLLVIGLIVLLFGGLGAGPQSSRDFVDGLNSPSEIKRWKTAQDLAQVLPRKAELRGDVELALQLTELLDRERRKPPPAVSEDDKKQPNPNEVPDLLEYLPAVVGSFRVPVGVPLLQEIIESNESKQQERGYLVRFRNGLLALGLAGARLQEFDALSADEKRATLATLQQEAGAEAGRKTWARLAHDCLSARMRPEATKVSNDVFGVVPTLRLGARSPDEFARKVTIMALAHWNVPDADKLLLQLAGDNSDLQTYENTDRERGQREVRYNAALALARRGSPLTPWSVVLEILDEERLRAIYASTDKAAPVPGIIVVALGALKDGRKANPQLYSQQPEILTAVQKLTKSGNEVVQVEAEKYLGGSPVEAVQPGHFSRQVLLMAGMAVAVFFLLGLAVFKRWQRASTPSS